MDEVSLPDRHARAGCAAERTEATRECGKAQEARQAYEVALERGRELRRRLTAARHTLEQAGETADPRRRQEAKDQARAAYQSEHANADTDSGRAEAAARWARVVDTINRETRKGVRAHAQALQVVSVLEGELRTADANEQSLHVTAEAGEAACLEARVRLAACEERALAPVAVAAPAGVGAPVRAPAGAAANAPTGVAGGPRAATAVAPPVATVVAPRTGQPGRADAGGPGHANRGGAPGPGVASGRSAAGGQGPGSQQRIGQGVPTVIDVLLGGDRRWLERVAALVSETVGRPAPEVFAHLRELVEALAATAGSHGYVVLDSSHEFWSRLTGEESRDVLAALARLGFQFEPSEGWHADRAPVQSDLSMALAYAGLDARSLRHLPTNAQLRELPRSISVDARALLANEAPDLALDHVVRMLGHRADSLGPLWDDWGYVRPILLSDPRSLP